MDGNEILLHRVRDDTSRQERDADTGRNARDHRIQRAKFEGCRREYAHFSEERLKPLAV